MDLDTLLAIRPSDRKKQLVDLDVASLTDREQRAVTAANTVEALAEALSGKIDEDATPVLAPPGKPLLQATDERRRSGSHYTPRSLTQPIVAETLRPILERLGPRATPEQILSLKVLDPAMGSGAFLVEACRQLADALVRAWEVHGVRPEIPSDEDALLYAKRLVVQRCLYGVDRNELAAELGKLSLWLATLARDHEFTFLDHCIRYGDSLVGLDRRQIEALSWAQQPAVPVDLMQELLRGRLAAAELERERIRKALDNEPEDQQRLVLRRAEQALADPKLAGDAVIAAFFSADKARAREEARLHIRGVIEQGGSGWQDRLKSNVTALRNGMPPVVPFHWPLQFPEVFDRNNPGFDAIIGNPPFAGKNTTIAVNADHYLDWLQTLHPGAHGNSDIVAHFFRRAYSLLRNGGCFGLLATNTIRQGDTRATGLRPIRQAGGTIYTARRRYKWPGEAAVTISVVHIAKGDLPGAYRLDSREVPLITAFLFHNGNDGDPIRLISNSNTCFEGFKIYGAGFLFEPSPETDDTTSFAEMRDIISRNPNSTRIIKPYLIADEVNGSANRTPNRFVIDFDDMSEADARKGFPDLMAILEKKVKPYRLKDKRENYRKRWWQFAETRPGLRNALAKLDEVLICPRVQKHWSVVRVDSRICLSDRLDVFCFSSHESFAVLQSRMHELWARFFGSTLEDRLLYTPVDCFETFPLPSIIADPRLQQIGQDYYRFRDGLATEYNEGLTELYNRFHDPDERSNAIGELRRLHDVMDRVILGAYGWTDIRPTCEFELEWEEGEAENGRRRRKPWRYRWPEPVRDEVLARLLALNAQRAEEERLALGDR